MRAHADRVAALKTALIAPVDSVSGFQRAAAVDDININGSTVGYASYPGGNAGAVLWRKGQSIDLGSLQLDVGFTCAAVPHAINGQGPLEFMERLVALMPRRCRRL